VPLSGGIDSCATAVIVYSMCRLVAQAASEGRMIHSSSAVLLLLIICISGKQVIEDARRIVGEKPDSSYVPKDAQEFCGRIFHTCYMATENSSVATRDRAKNLSKAIGR
jgi:NAD+ synthase (glutamine-hydrolysing)